VRTIDKVLKLVEALNAITASSGESLVGYAKLK
jgi:hypothetical protein